MRTVGERSNSQDELLRRFGDSIAAGIRVAIPGIIASFDPIEQVAQVQPAIRERVRDGQGNLSWVNLPLIVDVPVVFPRAGGFVLTMPVQPGDECLLVFGDMCMDAWWASGNVQNQAETRRHDLSDAFAIVGTWSQPRRLSGYSSDAAQLRTEDGSTYIELKTGSIDLHAASVTVNGVPL